MVVVIATAPMVMIVVVAGLESVDIVIEGLGPSLSYSICEW